MNDLRKEVGKYFLDISKLIFGGVVIASILKIDDISKILVLIVGTVVTFLFAAVGFVVLKKNN